MRAPRERLRIVRQGDARFDPRFFERSELFWPIARAASVFASEEDWPDVSRYAEAFRCAPAREPGAMKFVAAPPRRRRPAGPVEREELYDAVIVRRRAVPTRPRMWHDYLNALVWATFPRAKLALHTRQHAAIEAWLPPGATQLPNARTRELDALALVDEGGVLIVEVEATTVPVVFGHAIYEGLVFDQPAMAARALVTSAPPGADLVDQVDAALAALLADPARFVSPTELPRLALPAGNGPQPTRPV